MEMQAGMERALARRQLLQMGALAGLGAALMPRLAFAADSPELLPKVRELVARWTGPGKFPGMVATLGLPGRDPHFVSQGSEGFGDSDAVGPDSLFRIYSMTKPITGMAAMMLIEQGKMGLDQPVSDILPAYAKMNVQVTPDGSITDVRAAKNPMLIRNLLTHTAGIGYSIIQRGPLKAAMEERGVIAGQVSRMPVPGFDRGTPVPSLKLFADRLAGLPLVYEPGTKWSYSMGLDLLGRVIEVVSGKPFDRFLAERIFGPCGMTSTWFQVPRAQAGRLTTNYGVAAGVFVPIDPGKDSIYLDKPAFPFGGAGLVSSPRDYDKFLRMLAQYGRIGGKRVMGELAVRVGVSNLLPDGVEAPGMMGPGGSFGAGGRVGSGADAGAFGWAGAAGTVGSVNMLRGQRSSIFVQFMPPTSLPFLGEFQQALRADLATLAGQAG